jgi:hypothetical protein
MNNEICKVIKAIAIFWEEHLFDEYFLFIKTKNLSNYFNSNILFGNMRNAKVIPQPQGDSYSDIPLRNFLLRIDNDKLLFEANKGIMVPKIYLISSDLIYLFEFSVNNEILSVRLSLDNMTYGRGRMNDYIIATYNNGFWTLSGSDHYRERTSKYNHISGTIEDCINYIFINENELEHPYQRMIDSYPREYKKTQHLVFEINMNGTLGFNGQPYINL